MKTRYRRLSCLAALALVVLGLALVGCAWGVVTDAQTGEPIVGAGVRFQDSNGNSGTTTTGTGGLYAFDAATGQPIPAAGSTTYTITAPGYDDLTVRRYVAYDDSQSTIWEIQGFALGRPGSGPPPSQGVELAIDTNPSAFGIQTSRTVPASGQFSVDIVLVNPPVPLGAFSVSLLYDDTIIRAPEIASQPGPNLDSNPDANQAALGSNWDCSAFGFSYPRGDRNPESGPQKGDAHIDCLSLTGPYQFSSTGVIASVTFVPVAQGTSTLSLSGVTLYDDTGTEIGTCNPVILTELACGTASITMQ